MSQVKRQYTEIEVGRTFKNSLEYAQAYGLPAGHAEDRHSMGGSGKRRPAIDYNYLVDRGLPEASAYLAGDQIPVTTAALNSATGQQGLEELDGGARRVTLIIQAADLNLARAIQIEVAESTDTFEIPFGGRPIHGGYERHHRPLSHAVVVLEKRSYGLHIVTSYPTRTPPNNLANQSTYRADWE